MPDQPPDDVPNDRVVEDGSAVAGDGEVAAAMKGITDESGGIREALRGDVDDAELAVEQLKAFSQVALSGLAKAQPMVDPRKAVAVSDEGSAADRSFVGQLGRSAIEKLSDAATLKAVIRGGQLDQRRAALARLNALVAAREVNLSRSELDMIVELRDVELASELLSFREIVAGGVGRAARHEREAWRRHVENLVVEVDRFWSIANAPEPLMRLPGDVRASVLLHARDLPDSVARHMSALIEGADGVLSKAQRVDLIEALSYSADSRLLPAIGWCLHDSDTAMVVASAHALRRMQDPRALALLRRAYQRSVVDAQKAVVAGALASHGGAQGAEYVRALIDREEPETLLAALEALETLGTTADAARVSGLLLTC